MWLVVLMQRGRAFRRSGRSKLRPSRSRQDGGFPCGGRGATALPRNGHEIAPPQEVAVLEIMEAGRHAVTLFS